MDNAPRSRWYVLAWQLGLAAAFLLVWEFAPKVDFLRERVNWLDPFFISSPSDILSTLGDLAMAQDGAPNLWTYARPTIVASLLGTAIGMIGGASLGLLLSSFPTASRVAHPFILAANATPRVALIPIVVLFLGPTFQASVVLAVTVVFFVAFFNAFEGGTTVAPHLLQNARLLGASPIQAMRTVRFPYVLAWTLASLPLAITFALITVITAEILTGYQGLGRLLANASVSVDASLTYSVVVILAVLGVSMTLGAELLKRRVLHWWGK